MFILLTY